jgi:hypothetical protein
VFYALTACCRCGKIYHPRLISNTLKFPQLLHPNSYTRCASPPGQDVFDDIWSVEINKPYSLKSKSYARYFPTSIPLSESPKLNKMSAASVLPQGQPSIVDDAVIESTPAKSTSNGSEKEEDQIRFEPANPPPETRAVQGWKWVFVCFGLYFSIFLCGLDNTIAADIQSSVVDTYGDVSQLAWLGTGFPLGPIATILTL